MPVVPVINIIHCPVCGNPITIHGMVENIPSFFRIIGKYATTHIKCKKCNSLLIYNHKNETVILKK